MDRAGDVVTSLMDCKYGTPLRTMSSCVSKPRLVTLPRFGPKDRDSAVRFSSNTASSNCPLFDGGRYWLSVLAYGRKMVLNPRPTHLPVNAASGPRGADVVLIGQISRSRLTSPVKELPGIACAVTDSSVSVIL